MKTKLISILVIFLFSLTYVTAQPQGKTTFAVLGGVNFQNLTGKDHSGDKLENKLITGFHVGANVQIPLVPEFYFQPGILFSTKGGKFESNSVTTTTSLSYIEVPLNFMYKGMLGTGYVFLGLGPYIGYAVMGKVKDESGSESLKRDIEFQNVVELDDPLTVPYAKAFDMGGNIFFGYEMAVGVFAQLNAQLGLVKINSEYEVIPDDKAVMKNTGFGLSLGYRF
jgi:hypothetical protein